MNYVYQILFFFGAVGLFNSFILAFYFLFSKSYATYVNRFFGIYLLILSLRILKSLFYSFSTNEPIWFLQSGPAFFLLIGPTLFNYVAAIAVPFSRWRKIWKSHLILWCCIVILLIVMFPFRNYPELNKTTILPIINIQWLIYILLSVYVAVNPSLQGKRRTFLKNWLLYFLIANLMVWLCLSIIEFEYFISGSIIFSGLFYAFFLFFQLKRKMITKVFTKRNIRKTRHDSRESKEFVAKLNALMKREKLYTDPFLKVAYLAEKLDSTPHDLSRLLNENLGQNFTEFINTYRVEEAKTLMLTNQHYTIEAIGNLSGFNSKSAFYKAFKSQIGTTPAKFRRLAG